MNYPYVLGYHLPTKQLCRIPSLSINNGKIATNCVLILSLKYGLYRREFPLDNNGELLPKYWSIGRVQDIEMQQKLKQNQTKTKPEEGSLGDNSELDKSSFGSKPGS